jgi:drug/metabolite transporter (DMT)-like permease
MYVASVFQYLLIRKLQKVGVDNKINTFMFLTPAIPVAYAFVLYTNSSLHISIVQLVYIFVGTYLFSYLGNVFSFIGIKEAPNAGYSLVIQKSYAIYTAIAATFIFGSHLSFQALVSIFVIILFSSIIMINRSTSSLKNNYNWLKYSVLAFFMFGNLALLSKYMQILGVSPAAFAFYIFLFNGLFNGFALYKNKKNVNFSLNKETWVTLLIIGVSNGIFNISMFQAYKTAPNIGYVNIINAASITAITFLSAYFFKDKLTIEKVIGAIGVLLGLVLLVTL